MSELATTTPDTLSDAAPVANPPSKRLRWFELVLLLTIAFSGSIRSSLYFLKHGPNPALALTNGAIVFHLAHQFACILLLAYVLYRRGWRLQNLGLRWSFFSVFVGLLLAAAHFFVYIVALLLLRAGYRSWFGSVAHMPNMRDFFGQGNFTLVPYVSVNPVYEELIVRAYLMTELLDLTSSPLLAIFASIVV